MKREQIRIWKEAVTVYLKLLPRADIKRLRSKKEHSDTTSGNPTDFRTSYIPNTSLERYRYTYLPGDRRDEELKRCRAYSNSEWAWTTSIFKCVFTI
jgi:hypothetical protein